MSNIIDIMIVYPDILVIGVIIALILNKLNFQLLNSLPVSLQLISFEVLRFFLKVLDIF